MSRLFLLILIYLLPLILLSQGNGLELIHADRTIGQKHGSEQVRFFEGAVHFRQDTLDMYCHKAIFYDEQDRADFEGDVLIDDGKHRLYADKIEYYPQTRTAVCRRNVRISGVDDSLSADYLTFNFKTEKTSADQGLYVYNRKHQVQIWGKQGSHDPESQVSEVEHEARLVRIDTSTSDTLEITAHKLLFVDKNEPIAFAIGSVHIQQGSLSADCDTAIYYPDQEIAWLNQKPTAWYEDNKMWGRQIRIGFEEQALRTIDIYEDAQTISLVDSLKDQWNVLKGKEIHLDIRDKKPQKLRAAGTASSTYYLREEDEASGMNAATADTIFIYFKEGKADSIQILGGAQGVYYPEEYKGVKSGAE